MKPDARPHLSWIRCLAAALLGFAGTAQAVQPTISNVNDITGGSEDGSPIPTDIPFATLAAAANEADPDNTPVSFRIESFLPGSTLTLNGVNIIPGTTVFGSGTLRWTPPANTNGLLNAFAVKASSGGQVSESTVIVRVQIAEVDDPPTLGSVGAIAGGMEDTATSITFQEIQAAADEADIDSATINFRVESVISGELTSGGIPVQAGVTILSAGNPLSWTPAANANGLLAAFTLRAASGSEVSLNVVTVNVVTTPVNDAPTVAGSLPAAINDDSADSQAATAFLAGLTIADAENDNVDLVVRIAKTAEDLGDVVFPGVTRTESGSNYVYSFSSLTIAEANSRLDGARFNPIRDLLPAGTTQTFAVTVTVSDASTSSLTNSLNGNAGILSVDDPPQVALSFSSTSMPDNGPSQPFLVSINDPDSGANTSQTYTLTLTEITPVRGVLTIPVALTGTKAQVEAAMTSVRYQPNAVTANVSASFTCTITAPTLPVPPASTASLLIVLDNDQPGIAGINVSAIRTDEGVAVHPFPTVIVTDPDAGQTLTVTITPDNTAKGSFFLDNAALTANTSVPIVVLTGTAAEVTQKLRNLLYRPAVNRVSVGQTESTTLALAVNDGIASRSNSQTQIVSQSVNGAPDVSVPTTVVQPVIVTGETNGQPFTLVTVSDDDAVSIVTVTLSMDDAAKGTLSTLGGFTPLGAGSGIFTFTGTPDDATTALRGISYTISGSYQFPAGQPGATTFTIEARDSLNNRGTLVLRTLMQNAARNFLVTLREDNASLRPGSLRRAIADARDNDVITFAFASYPAVLRLDAGLQTIVLTKHLRFKGPGADLLTISGDSDGNGTPDFRIFDVQSTVVMEGLTVSHGKAASAAALTGGGFHVGRNPSTPSAAPGSLTLRHCAITDCVASQWGGAVDVEEGALVMEHCLVKGNATDPSAGLGGGAISLYTSGPCSFTATTFSGNKQRAAAGYGGGVIYAENFNPQTLFPVNIVHCTFSENEDAAVKGTSIHANVFNCRVTTRGSIFADAMQRNLHVAGSGEILTMGRNLSNDAARTSFIQGGQPQSILLLNQTSDQVSTDPRLLPLAAGIGGTEVYSLGAGSPAVGTLAAVEGPDHRGVLRDAAPDSGAVEASGTLRILINEVLNPPAPPAPAAVPPGFIEFYIPRDSTPVSLSGMEVWISGKLRHTFDLLPAGSPVPPVVQPGYGLILAENASVTAASAATPVFLSDNPFWEAGNDRQRTLIELRSGGVVVATAEVVNAFINPVVPAQTFANNSASLAPQFRGHAFVPNSTGQAPPQGPAMAHGGPAASPGTDTGGTPFGLSNAFPFAAADQLVVSEDDLVSFPVLGNDSDADGSDKLVLVNVSRTTSGTPPAGNAATADSFLNSGVSIAPSAAPLRGMQLWYDPRTAQNHLAAGVSAQDSFFYAIVDIGGGPITAYAGGGAATQITSAAHRLTTGEQIIISGSATQAYNQIFTVTKLTADTFSIPIAAAGNPAIKGSWSTTGTRLTTQRSEARATVTVLGRNDAPTPAADTMATTEEQILRIMGDPDLITPAPPFDTDPSYPAPRAFAAGSLLANDTDPDDDDNPFRKLRIVGVTQANAVTGYLGTAGQGPVTVSAAGHGLTSGTPVLISGYGGHSSYNGYHTATVIDADTFTIPIAFVENHPQKGLCGILTSEGRLQTTSAMGARVSLEIRANRQETNLVYVPRGAPLLNRLSLNEVAADTFYYVTEDSHGAQALAKVTVNVTGVNDAPVTQDDPPSLGNLASLAGGGTALRDVLAGARVDYSVPSTADEATVTLTADGRTFVFSGVPRTNEETAISLTATRLLGNDSDVDHLDTLNVTLAAGQNVSREGAAISLAGGGASVVYNPAVSARLNALSREEKIIDTFALTISDGTTGVVSIVAVEVTGRNDQPTALADAVTIPEDQLLTVAPPGVLLNDRDPDQDTRVPDNRKLLIPVTDLGTTVHGTRLNAAVAAADGAIDSFAGASGDPAATRVNAPGHGLNTGEEIIISGTALAAYNGQFPITRLDGDAFTIPVPSATGAVSAGSGFWESLRSTVSYDPRGSVFEGAPAGTVFTLDGLAQGQTYQDIWNYTMFDGSLIFANNDMFRVEADSAGVEFNVFANDVNLTGFSGTLRLIAVSTPSQRGTVSIGADNTLIYTPETGFAGDEYFTYTVADGMGNTDTALVTARVTIEQLNGNLQANHDDFTVAKGQSPLLAVLANDDIVPATGMPITIQRISSAPDAGGTAVIEGNAIRFTPAGTHPAYPYTETFAYEISGGGTARAVATVAIMVANRENTLSLRADAVSVQAGSSNNPLNVLANDNILPGSGLDLIITATSIPNGGTVKVSTDQKRLLFTPDAGFLGTSTFTYTASDTLGGTGTATVRVAVGGLTTNNDFFTVSSVTATPVTLDVLANDRVMGAPGNVTIKAMAANITPVGTLAAVTTGAQTLSFTPVAGQTGERTFSYLVEDGTGREAAGSVTIFLSGPGLLANSDFFTVQAGSLSNELEVLLNDTQIPDLGLPRTIARIGTGGDAPDHGGSALVNETGTRIRYTPAVGFSGEERFTYSVTNGDTAAVAQVIVRVTDGALVAADDAFSVSRGSSPMRLEVLSNDRVIPSSGQTLTITGIGIVQNAPGQQGTVTLTDDAGALLYTPNGTNSVYPYTESFTYEISDGSARRAQGTVNVLVLDRAGAREMETNDDAFTVLADAQNVLLGVLANDDIRPASAAGWEITGIGPRSQGGNAVLSGEGIAYSPLAGFVGTETFSYTVSDGLGGTGAATVTVKVGDVMVSDDSFSVLSGSGSTALAVLANDGLFPDGFPGSGTRPGLAGFSLDLAPMTPNRGGTATVSGDRILYRPAANFSGGETFTYWVRDDSGIRFPGQVTVNVEPAGSDRSAAALAITVTGVNDLPLILGTSRNPIGDKQTTHPFSGVTIRDVDNQLKELITVRISFPAAHGALSGAFNLISPGLYQFIGNGSQATAAIRTLVYTPVENRIIVAGTEETSFAVSLQDPFITTPVINSTSTAAVTAVNDAPVLTGTRAGQRVYLNSGIAPFEGVRISDVDDLAQQTQIVTITIDNAIKGTLTNPGGFVESPPGTWIRIGTPSQVTAAIRGLIFTPTPENRVTPGSSETVNFTFTVNDGFAPALTDSITTVIVQHPFMKKLLPLTLAGTDASQTGARYGADVDISGDTLVVGSELRDGTLVDSGAVHVYERQSGGIENWGQAARLAPADLAADDSFGGAVALDGDFLAVAADRQTVSGVAGAGVVYIFQRDALDRNAWNQVAKVSEPAGERNAQDNFGEALALHGTTLLVGAPYANQPLADSGAVFVFEKNKDGVNAWGFTQKLLPTAGVGERAALDQFGFSVAIEGNLLAVGAYGVDRITPVPGADFGAVYLFERPNPAGTWAQSAKVQIFNEPGASASDLFGCELDLSGNTLAVGACGYDRVVGAVTHLRAGAAFVFERNQGGNNNWGLSKPLFAPEPAAEDRFGHSVGLARDLVLVGAPKQINSTHPLSKAGYAGVFRRQQGGAGNWGLLEVLQPAGAGQNDLFGFNCGLDRFSAVIGANLDKINVSNAVGAGASYVYEFKFNNAPALAQPIPNQAAKPDVAFLFPVPAGTFSDADDGDVLTYQATLADGSAIPAGSWLQFNPATATFSGTPTLTNYHPLSLIIKATDEQGLTVGSNVFTISVDVDRGRTFGLAFEKWQQAHFTPAVLANPALESTTFGSNANPDRDPYSNLLEMALGLDPNATNPPGLITLEVNAPLITLVYPLANDFPAGFSRVEWSLDLTTWREINVSTTVRTQLANYRMLASSAFPPTPSGRIYLRLRVGP